MRTDELIRRLAAAPPPADPVGLERRAGAALLLALALAAAAVWLAFGVRADLGPLLLTGAGALKFAGGGAVALAGWRLSCRFSRPGVSPFCPVSATLLVGAAALAAATVGAADLVVPLPAALRSAPICIWPILMLAAPALALTLAALRTGAPTRPTAAGAAAGLAAGAAGALAYALWCPAEDARFVVVAYGAALAIMAGAGAVAGRRVLAW